jgi:hypothetical protein
LNTVDSDHFFDTCTCISVNNVIMLSEIISG